MEKTSMRDLVMAVGGPLMANENRKSWLLRVADWTGLHPRVVKAAFYQETESEEVALKLKAAAGRAEAHNLARQFESLASSLETKDASFFSPHADALRDMARTFRGFVDPIGNQDRSRE